MSAARPDVGQAEAWFLDHGLPYFVAPVRGQVRSRLARPRLVVVAVVALGVSTAAGILTGLLDGEVATGTTVAMWVLVGLLAAYALRALRAGVIAAWALRRALASRGLMLPLATRALPMLLLFVTFLFINTEVWMVASALEPGVLAGAVLFFGLAAVGFLVARLDEELGVVDDHVDAEELLDLTEGTPLAAAAREVVADGTDLDAQAEVAGLEKANLVLVLVIAQAVQVLLLAVAVWLFFVVFGTVAIDDRVVEQWIGASPNYPPGPELVSEQLAKVAVFLASFSGLYFTVYAVTDANYRQQFFTTILRELAQAVGVRAVYLALLDLPEKDAEKDAGKHVEKDVDLSG